MSLPASFGLLSSNQFSFGIFPFSENPPMKSSGIFPFSGILPSFGKSLFSELSITFDGGSGVIEFCSSEKLPAGIISLGAFPMPFSIVPISESTSSEASIKDSVAADCPSRVEGIVPSNCFLTLSARSRQKSSIAAAPFSNSS